MVDPENKLIDAYRLQGDLYVLQAYRIQDTAEPAIFPGLTIALSTLFA
jgi:Uma2 family endonuclease